MQLKASSLDKLIGAQQQRLGDRKAERLGGREGAYELMCAVCMHGDIPFILGETMPGAAVGLSTAGKAYSIGMARYPRQRQSPSVRRS